MQVRQTSSDYPLSTTDGPPRSRKRHIPLSRSLSLSLSLFLLDQVQAASVVLSVGSMCLSFAADWTATSARRFAPPPHTHTHTQHTHTHTHPTARPRPPARPDGALNPAACLDKLCAWRQRAEIDAQLLPSLALAVVGLAWSAPLTVIAGAHRYPTTWTLWQPFQGGSVFVVQQALGSVSVASLVCSGWPPDSSFLISLAPSRLTPPRLDRLPLADVPPLLCAADDVAGLSTGGGKDALLLDRRSLILQSSVIHGKGRGLVYTILHTTSLLE